MRYAHSGVHITVKTGTIRGRGPPDFRVLDRDLDEVVLRVDVRGAALGERVVVVCGREGGKSQGDAQTGSRCSHHRGWANARPLLLCPISYFEKECSGLPYFSSTSPKAA